MGNLLGWLVFGWLWIFIRPSRKPNRPTKRQVKPAEKTEGAGLLFWLLFSILLVITTSVIIGG